MKLIILTGLTSLCICCSRAPQGDGSSDVRVGIQLCTTPGVSIIRVEKNTNHGIAWGSHEKPFLKADSVELSYLLQVAFNLRPARFELRAPLPPGAYNVELPSDADAKDQDGFPVKGLRTAFREAFGLSLSLETKDREALILTLTRDGIPEGLVQSEKNTRYFAGTRNGGYEVRAGTVDSLCDMMECAILLFGIGLPLIPKTSAFMSSFHPMRNPRQRGSRVVSISIQSAGGAATQAIFLPASGPTDWS
jgi:hypothetical protein